MRKCQAKGCDRTTETHPQRVGFCSEFQMILCAKHKSQMKRHGRIFEQSREEGNKIEIFEDFAKIYFNDSKGNIKGFFTVDIEDVEKISPYKWFQKNDGRIVTNVTKLDMGVTHLRAHNVILDFVFENLFILVDHIDRDPTNNRKANLRVVDAQTNIINRGMQKNNTSGVVGVAVKENKSGVVYIAQLKFNRKTMRFGTYVNFKDAVLARAKAEMKFFGEDSVNYNRANKSIRIEFFNPQTKKEEVVEVST